MDHVMSNFGNINYKAELEVKVSLLETENFELRGQLMDKLLKINNQKQIQEAIRSLIMFLLQQIWSLHQPKPMITSTAIMIIITSAAITVKTIKMTTTTTKIKRTIIALMKRQFATKSYKHNCRKFERKDIKFF